MHALSSAKKWADAGNSKQTCVPLHNRLSTAAAPSLVGCHQAWGQQGCLGLEWGVPHMLLAWGYELQVLQVSSHQERGAQPVILQDLAMDVLCLTARAGLCCWEMWGVVQFSKCSSTLYPVYPLSTQTPWSLCLLPSVGTCLFISEPVELGED